MPSPSRARPQLHLSTAIVLSFFAGILIWLNVHPHERIELKEEIVISSPNYIPKQYFYIDEHRGWPLTAYVHFLRDENLAHEVFVTNEDIEPAIGYFAGLLNLTVALSILFASWFLCEWQLRRRNGSSLPTLNPER